MGNVAIRVEGLSKQFHIGSPERYRTLRDTLFDTLAAPFRFMRNGGFNKAPAERIWALKDVSFEVKHGEVIGIIGRNGAGKSTLLKILSRITEPTTGYAEIHGRVGSLLEVGTGFHPELTGRENIFLNGAILGMKKAEILRRFDEIVAFAEVEKFIDTPVKHYSSGMYVRLAFAVAAHLDTDILVVDEVLAVGDAEFQKKCLGRMREVGRGGRTVLFVSHNTSAVQSLCGTGVLLDRGRLRRSGPVASVIRDYLTGIRRSGGLGQDTLIDLGPSLLLKRLNFEPKAIVSGGPLSIQIELVARSPAIIREMSVLIYSEHGVRVAVMDLRNDGFGNLAIGGTPLEFEVCIDTLPLVEGDYRVGLFIATNEYQDDYLDLAALNVAGSQSLAGTIPYAAYLRGFVELDFSIQLPVTGRI